ncbi:MAG: T9SS type A sorting domain-containing protein, partial [Ignavibacteriaceae bacterium]|nr:T9SS type A sorting domain-containing protein [Ignavibacteriaceae bacterium]
MGFSSVKGLYKSGPAGVSLALCRRLAALFAFLCSNILPQGFNGPVTAHDFFPLSVGNKWQYLFLADYSIKDLFLHEINDTISRNGIKYHIVSSASQYGVYNEPLRNREDSLILTVYYNGTEYTGLDFTKPAGSYHTGLPFFTVNFPRVPGPVKTDKIEKNIINGDSLFRYVFLSGDGFSVKDTYLEKYGLIEREGPGAPPPVRYIRRLARAVINDGGSKRYYSDGAKPSVSFNPAEVTNKLQIKLDAVITHPYEMHPYNGIYFTDSVWIDYYYSDGSNSTPVTRAFLPGTNSSVVYSFNYTLDSLLMSDGYKFYYRFTARDKGLVPEFTSSPETGWYKLEYDPLNGNYWITQSTITHRLIQELAFINKNDGFALSTGDNSENYTIFYRTDNGGRDWYMRTIMGIREPRKLYFLTDNIWFLCGYGTESGRLFKTTNRGETWFNATESSFYGIPRDIVFVNNTTGYLISEQGDGALYKTTDQGVTWQLLYRDQVTYQTFSHLSFTDSLSGTIASEAGMIFKTHDGGATWQKYNSGRVTNDFFMSDSLNCWIASEGGYIYKSTNGGISWTEIKTSSSANLLQIRFINSQFGYAVGESGAALATSDGGLTWKNEMTGTGYDLSQLTDAGRGYVWAAGANGIILKRIDPFTGMREDELGAEAVPDGFVLHQNYPNPFNPSTVILVVLPAAGKLKADVFDLLGREVSTLADDFFPEGQAELNFNGAGLPSGVYFCRVKYGGSVKTIK